MKNNDLTIDIGPDDALELQNFINDNLKPVVPLAGSADLMKYDGPAPGSFGFGEGLLTFFGKAWADLMAIPDAVTAIANGIKAYLEKRPSNSIVIKRKDTSIRIRGDYDLEKIKDLIAATE